MSIKLSDTVLNTLSHQISVPSYNRADLTAGIVHIGVGNFHRAHQAMYLHQLFEQGLAHDWAICGAGIKSFDDVMRNKLAQQNWLSTVVELEEGNIVAHVCGSMIDFVDVDAAKIIQTMTQDNIKIVSLTITEGGYFIDPDNGEFDVEHPEIQADIQAPEAPVTVFGIMIEALKIRRENGSRAFTIMSCDNIPHNGDVTKKAILGLAELIEPGLARWISENVSFPNSMVDCIAPMVSAESIDRIEHLFGVTDNAPVLCESFRQWVLEDNFVNGRPALEEVGVQFVDDVAPYELMKLRVLNGGHAALAYPAGLMGIELVHDAMANQTITAYLEKLMTDEVIPSLPEVQGIDVHDYLAIIKQRFSNPEIKDTIQRLYQDGQNRLPKFILPTICDNLDDARSVNGLSLVIALWCKVCMLAHFNMSGIVLLGDDNQAIIDAALKASDTPETFIGMSQVFGALSQSPELLSRFSFWLAMIHKDGVEPTLQHYINQ